MDNRDMRTGPLQQVNQILLFQHMLLLFGRGGQGGHGEVIHCACGCGSGCFVCGSIVGGLLLLMLVQQGFQLSHRHALQARQLVFR